MPASTYRKAIVLLHLFTGITALAGGFALIADSTGALLGFSIDILGETPFPDFLLPGMFLVFFLGFGNLGAAIGGLDNSYARGSLAVLFGNILVLWIAVQVYWVGLHIFLQPLYLAIGISLVILGRLVRNAELESESE